MVLLNLLFALRLVVQVPLWLKLHFKGLCQKEEAKYASHANK